MGVRSIDRTDMLTRAPVLGANLNGRPHRLGDALELVDASGTTWVRAFIDVRTKRTNAGPPEDDPDVVALRRAVREGGCKLLVSLKWDFTAKWGDKEPARVPEPGSARERALYACAARYLEAIDAPIDAVVLGNEPMWETPDPDITVDAPPVVRFTRDLKDHLVRNGDHGDPAYLLGSFNRLHSEHTRTRRFPGFHRTMFELARADDDIDGVDLHVHYDGFDQAEAMLAAAREELPDGVITVSEISPVWRYERYVDVPIDASGGGARFAREYGLPGGTTPVEYFERAKETPRAPGELAAFYAAMPWYNEDHVADVYDLLVDYDVSVGTIGFLQGLGMRDEDWTTGWLPFHINFLYQPALLRTDRGLEGTAHPHYIDDYRERAAPEGARSP